MAVNWDALFNEAKTHTESDDTEEILYDVAELVASFHPDENISASEMRKRLYRWNWKNLINRYKHKLQGDPFGYIYVLNKRGTDYYRIGQTSDLPTRLSTHIRHYGLALKFVNAIRCLDYVDIEVLLHKRLRPRRKKPSWYELTVREAYDGIPGLILGLEKYREELMTLPFDWVMRHSMWGFWKLHLDSAEIEQFHQQGF